jgi:ribonuclease P protein component
MRFRPDQHLRRQRDFRAVREQGRRIDAGPFTLWWLKHPALAATATSPESEPVSAALPSSALPRVGVVASTAAVGGAVQRNRAKRRLRALFRQHQPMIPADSDLLLVARTAVNRISYAELEQKFVIACRRLAPTKNA